LYRGPPEDGRAQEEEGDRSSCPGDVRYEDVAEPAILKPTDAIIKLATTCICGSDLWSYRGLETGSEPRHMGHEYCGVVVRVGSDVK
jgi:threonine dehydrogenase-like Zn-dependent dehydrogenase